MPNNPINSITLARRQYSYTPDVGKIPKGTKVYCGVCGDECIETRNCYGPRTYIDAMTKHKSSYDSWSCPNGMEIWHIQAYMLMCKSDETPSARLAKLYEEEIIDILKSRKETKKFSIYG